MNKEEQFIPPCEEEFEEVKMTQEYRKDRSEGREMCGGWNLLEKNTMRMTARDEGDLLLREWPWHVEMRMKKNKGTNDEGKERQEGIILKSGWYARV